jgi:hypothetical protein
MTNIGYSNVIPFARNLPQAHMHRSITAARKATKLMAAQVSEADDDYRSRMFASALVAGFVGMLVMSGQWMFTVLASIH